MTLWDDVPSLLTKLRHTFLNRDDTGLSEVVIPDDTVNKDQWNIKENCLIYNKKNGAQKVPISPDVYLEMDYGARRQRRRSQTDERLEKLKRDKLAYSTEHVQWKEPTSIPLTEREEMFVRKELIKNIRSPENFKKSALSIQLENSVPDLPFREYAKYDLTATPDSHAKFIDVLTTMATGEWAIRPLRVIVLNSATVRETIGLACWLYTREGRMPPLSENVDLYDLYMEESEGADMDFPPIDKREPISKFGFGTLALVQQEQPKTPKKSTLFVTVHISTKGMTKVQVDDMSTTMREIMDKVINRRVKKDTMTKGLNYNLEKYDKPGISVDLNQPLSAMNTYEFFMVRENSARVVSSDTEVVDLNTIADSLSSFQYKLYRVYTAHKLLQKREFHLGLSRDQIEITQVSKTRPGKSKTTIYDTKQVAGCEITDQKSTNKATFRFIYQATNGKLEHHDFDSDLLVAVEIATKINSIVDFFSSPIRTDYLKSKGVKTMSNRKSLHSES